MGVCNSTYSNTAIQVNGYSSSPMYLALPAQGLLPQDIAPYLVTQQDEGSLFNVPNGTYCQGFSATGSSTGPLGNSSDVYTAFTDVLSFAQPLLFALPGQLDNEPNTQAVFCGVQQKDGSGPTNQLTCNFNNTMGFKDGSFAICEIMDYSKGDLYIYDPTAYNNSAPPTCTAVTLEVLAVGNTNN